MDPAGNVYFSEGVYLRKIAAAWPGLSFEQTVVPSPDGTEAFVFGLEGRHEETLDAVRGTTLLSFGYDSAGRLLNITDGDGNVTTVHRNASGEPLSIEAPFGQTTQLTVGEWGMLSEITAPDGATWSMTYHGTHGADPEDHGQLATFQTPRGHQYELTYDAFGRLEKDLAPDGSSQNLSRTGWPWDYEVTRTTELGRDNDVCCPDARRREPASNQHDARRDCGNVHDERGWFHGGDAGGRHAGDEARPRRDPRFGLVLPYVSESTTTLPSGLASTTTRAHYGGPLRSLRSVERRYNDRDDDGQRPHLYERLRRSHDERRHAPHRWVESRLLQSTSKVASSTRRRPACCRQRWATTHRDGSRPSRKERGSRRLAMTRRQATF